MRDTVQDLIDQYLLSLQNANLSRTEKWFMGDISERVKGLSEYLSKDHFSNTVMQGPDFFGHRVLLDVRLFVLIHHLSVGQESDELVSPILKNLLEVMSQPNLTVRGLINTVQRQLLFLLDNQVLDNLNSNAISSVINAIDSILSLRSGISLKHKWVCSNASKLFGALDKAKETLGVGIPLLSVAPVASAVETGGCDEEKTGTGSENTVSSVRQVFFQPGGDGSRQCTTTHSFFAPPAAQGCNDVGSYDQKVRSGVASLLKTIKNLKDSKQRSGAFGWVTQYNPISRHQARLACLSSLEEALKSKVGLFLDGEALREAVLTCVNETKVSMAAQRTHKVTLGGSDVSQLERALCDFRRNTGNRQTRQNFVVEVDGGGCDSSLDGPPLLAP